MNAKTTGVYLTLALALVVVAALVLVPSLSVEAVAPAGKARRTFSDKVVSRVCGFFRGARASAENVRLKREIAALALLSVDIERLEAENVRLRRALGYRDRMRERWIAAPVISRGGGSTQVHESLRVARGSSDGIEAGAIVVVPEGLVGQVASVTAHTSEIRLLTDPTSKVHCEVEMAANVPLRGVLSGGGDVYTLKYLTGDTQVPVQSRVLSSGKGGVFPKGLMVGTFAGFISCQDGSAAREATVKPAVDFDILEDVFIRRVEQSL